MTDHAAELQNGVAICDGTFVLRCAKDRMTAYVVPKGENAAPEIDQERLRNEMRQHGIEYGVLDSFEALPDGSFLAARGKAVRHGEDAHVKLHVKPAAEGGSSSKNDSSERKEEEPVVNVCRETLLSEKIPFTEGVAGIDIFGREVVAKPGKDRAMKFGSGVTLSEDGLKLFAKVDGKFVIRDGRPVVLEEHTVNGDIDAAVGDLAFVGASLIVNGEVLPGFSVKCKGAIVVQKGVNNASVMAEGDINIQGGVVGENALLRSKGSIKIDFAESGPRLSAQGNLIVEDFIAQCNVRLGGDVLAVTGDGKLIGGEYVVTGSIYVKELGSDDEVPTMINVGVKPSLLVRRQEAANELQVWSERVAEILKNMTTLEKMKKEQGKKFPADKEELLKKYRIAMPKASERVNNLTELEKTLTETLDEMVNEKVYVLGKLYPGITVKIGNLVRYVSREEERVVVCFDRDSHQIVIRKMTEEEGRVFS